MKTHAFIAVVLFSFAMSSFAGDPKIEQAVRDADEQWSRAAANKDVEKTISFYAAGAIVLPPNAPTVTSQDGIRELWKTFLDGLSTISWKTTRVEVAKSGDMAYLTGTYEMTSKEGTSDHGKYLEVFKKETDGSWKCGADMFSSDLPASAPNK